VYTLPDPLSTSVASGTDVYFSLENGTVTLGKTAPADYDFYLENRPGCTPLPGDTFPGATSVETNPGENVGVAEDTSAAGCSPALQLGSGDVVGSSLTYIDGADLVVGSESATGYDWSGGDTGYVGLEVTDASSEVRYGWANVSLGLTTSGTPNATLNSFAYDATPGEAVTIGAPPAQTLNAQETIEAPEPSALELLAVGAAAFGLVRLRRRTSSAAATPATTAV
jgi:hypothetical protein